MGRWDKDKIKITVSEKSGDEVGGLPAEVVDQLPDDLRDKLRSGEAVAVEIGNGSNLEGILESLSRVLGGKPARNTRPYPPLSEEMAEFPGMSRYEFMLFRSGYVTEMFAELALDAAKSSENSLKPTEREEARRAKSWSVETTMLISETLERSRNPHRRAAMLELMSPEHDRDAHSQKTKGLDTPLELHRETLKLLRGYESEHLEKASLAETPELREKHTQRAAANGSHAARIEKMLAELDESATEDVSNRGLVRKARRKMDELDGE